MGQGVWLGRLDADLATDPDGYLRTQGHLGVLSNRSRDAKGLTGSQTGMVRTERSLERITDEDLTKLAGIAAADRAAFYSRYPRYRDAKVLCVALCQGAALHYISGDNGINDFDVWTFYEGTQEIPDFPCRRVSVRLWPSRHPHN